MKKRLFAILIACVCMFGFAFAPGTFTYVSAPTDAGVTGGASTETAVTVADAEELAAKGQDTYFNAAGIVSETGDRVSLKLTADIVLGADVTLSADCNLDLGGFTLTLGACTLTVRHNYAGAFVLTGGALDASGGGKLVLQTPNAYWQTDVAGAAVDASSVTADSADRDAKVAAAARNFVTEEVSKGGWEGSYHGDVPLPARFGSLGRFNYTVPAEAASLLGSDGRANLRADDASTDVSIRLGVTFTPTAGNADSFTVPLRLVGARNAAVWSRLLNDSIAESLNAVAVTGRPYAYEATLSSALYLPVDSYWYGSVAYSTGTPEYASVEEGSGARVAYLDVSAMKTDAASPDLTVTVQGIETVYRLEIVSSGAQTDVPAKILRLFFGTDDASVLAFAKGSNGEFTAYPLAYPTADAAKNQELAALGLESIVKTTLYYNSQSVFTKANDVLTINPAAADDSAVAQLEITMRIEGEEVTRLVDLRYTTSATDTQANPARFRTHFSYFEQQFRNGTHAKYELDGTVTLSATKNGAHPFVAFRITDPGGATYATPSADGGIDVTFRGSDGALYTPVYTVQDGNSVFDGFAECAADGAKSRLERSMEKFIKSETAATTPVWILSVDPEQRNVRKGVADETLLLEYQYSFADDFGKEGQNWFVYTDVTDASKKETSRFTLLSLVMQGTDAAAYDFGGGADDTALYQAIKSEFAPNFNYIPRKYLGESREELNVKALFYPDQNPTDGVSNSDLDNSGYEKDSIAGKTFGNWNWLAYLTGVKTLNLHGMHMTDALITSHLSKMTWLTGLDVSGVCDRTEFADGFYDEGNSGTNTSLAYAASSSDVTDAGLQTIAQTLNGLGYLNVAFCRIQEFAGLAYLSDNIEVCRLEGNKTGGTDTRPSSLGSSGGYSAVFISGLAARCKVYRYIDSDELVVQDDVLQAVWSRLLGFYVQSELPVGTDLEKDVVPTLPTNLVDDLYSFSISTPQNGTFQSYSWENKKTKYVVDGNEILMQLSCTSWNVSGKTPVIFIRRLAFTFV